MSQIQGNTIFSPSGEAVFALSDISSCYKHTNDSPTEHYLKIYFLGGEDYRYIRYGEDKERRDADFNKIAEILGRRHYNIPQRQERGKISMIDSIKRYYRDHEDVLFPLLVVIVLDHFFNSGRLRDRVISLAQKLLDGVQDKLTVGDKPILGSGKRD